jgi:proline utilization trans-activator
VKSLRWSLVSGAPSNQSEAAHPSRQPHNPRYEQLVEDCTAEHFVSKLQEISNINSTNTDSSANIYSVLPNFGGAKQSHHTYTLLKFGSICKWWPLCVTNAYVPSNPAPPISLSFPPLPYTVHLFELFCNSYQEYHWFLKRSFRDRIQSLYLCPKAESHDRNWLCKFSVFLALSETLSSSFGGVSNIHSSQQSNAPQEQSGASCSPPGADLFEQGLQLSKVSVGWQRLS